MKKLIALLVFLLSCVTHSNGEPIHVVDFQPECMKSCDQGLTACSVMSNFRPDTGNQCIDEWNNCTALCHTEPR